MDEETLSSATEPFFTTKGAGKGTGLGLPMVHGLAEQSGGRLELESRPGAGTTASLWFPKNAPAQAAAEPFVPARVAAASRPVKVLAVDDDALVLLNTAAMLEDMGHTVVTSSSGEEALRLMGEGEFGLLVTDQGMPGMTGLQLLDRARRTRPDLPVILATGYAELPQGAPTTFVRLSKPFFQNQLADAVAEAIGGGSAG